MGRLINLNSDKIVKRMFETFFLLKKGTGNVLGNNYGLF